MIKCMRRPCKFTEADLRRAIRAARKEGVLARIELMPDGRISITPITGTNTATTTAPSDRNEWDGVAYEPHSNAIRSRVH
jgi:hypothetical protein